MGHHSTWLLGLGVLLSVGCGGPGGTGDTGGGGGDSGGGPDWSGPADVGPAEVGEDAGGADGSADAVACEQGQLKCVVHEGTWEVHSCVAGQWVWTHDCADNAFCVNGTCIEETPCDPGDVDGCYSLSQYLECNAEGTGYVPVDCPEETLCIGGVCEDTECIPGQAQCVDPETKQTCNDDGVWDEPVNCGAGLSCVGGKCMSQCLNDPKWNNSYIGCEYWTLDLDNYPDPFSPTQPDEAPHGIILGNPGTATATITFKSFASDVPFNLLTTTVEAGSVRVIELPRMDIDGSVITDRSVRVVSNRPVVAYQFNPLDFQAAYSDDSSLLIPAEMLGKEYLILSYMTSPLEAISIPGMNMPSQHGYFTVLAVEEGETEVSVRVVGKAESPEDPNVVLQEGIYHPFVLQQGQVLNLQATGKTLSGNLDLSGSHVIGNKKLAVFSGHEEAVVQGLETDPVTGEPADCCCAEHLEEQLFPLETWASTYLCVKAAPRGPSDLDLWRVQAGVANVTLTTDPPIPGINGQVLQNKGDWVEAFTGKSFLLTASGPVQAAQYLSSQGCTDDFIGDPALVMAVSSTQYRTPYAFAVPDDYDEDWISVVRPAGAEITLDGAVLPDGSFDPIASSGYEVGYFEVQDGPHYIEGEDPFGMYQFGFDGPSSYGHPGGLNLTVQQQL
ncbi:MAG: IgGFc-binding protein [Deltaproteobacteria bacterium]|nr:IgGFc-binding protein [Deltaproteobacteria bacterium]